MNTILYEKILNHLGVAEGKQLIGKILKVRFTHVGYDRLFITYFIVSQFCIDDFSLSFPILPFGNYAERGSFQLDVTETGFRLAVTDIHQEFEGYVYAGTDAKKETDIIKDVFISIE